MNRLWLACLLLTLAAPLSAETPAAVALQKLNALSGDWDGTFSWTGARTSTGKMSAHYYATGNGSAVVEDLLMDGSPTMTSVYHLDGSDLRVTHYCGAQNQPRLKATTISPAGDQLTFSFVDITNLASPAAGHVHGLDLRFLDPDHINIRFHFKAGDKDSDELIDLKRKK